MCVCVARVCARICLSVLSVISVVSVQSVLLVLSELSVLFVGLCSRRTVMSCIHLAGFSKDASFKIIGECLVSRPSFPATEPPDLRKVSEGCLKGF